MHSTNETSTILKLEPDSGKFTQFPVKGETAADNPVINLAAAQLVFDKERNRRWHDQRPVCNMMVDEKKAKFISEVGGRKAYLCSAMCKNQFDGNPKKYGY